MDIKELIKELRNLDIESLKDIDFLNFRAELKDVSAKVSKEHDRRFIDLNGKPREE